MPVTSRTGGVQNRRWTSTATRRCGHRRLLICGRRRYPVGPVHRAAPNGSAERCGAYRKPAPARGPVSLAFASVLRSAQLPHVKCTLRHIHDEGLPPRTTFATAMSTDLCNPHAHFFSVACDIGIEPSFHRSKIAAHFMPFKRARLNFDPVVHFAVPTRISNVAGRRSFAAIEVAAPLAGSDVLLRSLRIR